MIQTLVAVTQWYVLSDSIIGVRFISLTSIFPTNCVISAAFTVFLCVSEALIASFNGSIEVPRVQSMVSGEIPVVTSVHRAAAGAVR